MKNDKLVKFGLSVLFAAVLSACGGSSNKNDNAGKPEVDPNEGKKPEVTETTGDKLTLPTETYHNFQAAKNLQSEYGNTPVAVNDVYHGLQPAKLEPHKSLDTIVIATPRNDNIKSAYLEDFQFTNDVDGTPFDFESNYNESVEQLATLAGAIFDKGAATQDQYLAFIKAKVDAVKEGLKKETEAKLKDPSVNKELLLAQDKFTINLLDAINSEVEKQFAAEKNYAQFNPKAFSENAVKYLSKDKATMEAAKKALKDSVSVVEKALKPSGEALNGLVLLSDRVAGQTLLTGIYLNEGTKSGNNRASKEVTETETQGTKEGKAFLYQEGRLVYFTNENKEVAKDLYAANEMRNLNGSVAEVYGSKTYGYEVNNGTKDYTIKNDGGANAPFINKNSVTKQYTDGGKLEYVQYGRVTSAIHDKTPEQFKDGVLKNTVVTTYGQYGDNGTENTYFSRGINHTTNAEVAKLSGKLTYHGHAVSNGLDNAWDGKSSNSVPNAIGGAEYLYSGNHVVATIDTGNREVLGNIYNIWTDGSDYRDVKLVNFKGAFGHNGNIEGTSELAYETKVDNKEGSFHAALFGHKGEELAGMVKSKTDDSVNGWVAAFGAKRAADVVAPTPAGSPWDPRNEFGTNSNNGGFNAGAAANAGSADAGANNAGSADAAKPADTTKPANP